MKINIKGFLNRIEKDEFGRINAILAVNKPVGKTSHDIVDQVRRKLGTRRVGHAGALDPFASGLLIILVGKFTKFSESLILEDKQYDAKIVLGLSTRTQDVEGEILQRKETEISKVDITKALESFSKGYDQFVSVYSSVKVGGQKLRELARKSSTIEVREEGENKDVIFTINGKEMTVNLPKKHIDIKEIKLQDSGEINSEELNFYKGDKIVLTYAKILISVSKGTYIRQFAEDLGEKLGVPGMLCELKRLRIGDVNLDECIDVDSLVIE